MSSKDDRRNQGQLGRLAQLGLATSALLWVYHPATNAQTPESAEPREQQETLLLSEANQLFVNPGRGNDVRGSGTATSPFKTIAHALEVAESNATIVLAPGTYSAQSGETFPLQLKAGVTLKGNPATKGRGIVISGGGQFVSRTFASQNVAVVAASGSTLTGVTITNANRRGYGLWIESTNPRVIKNTFTGSVHDGISVTGSGAPVIRENTFIENGANGITVYGTSKPQIVENEFQKTGFGINVAQNSAAELTGNTIRYNRDGVVVQGSARPVLRKNRIEGNRRNGLVTISDARPDLGTADNPGGNIFINNRESDINASASRQIIPAFGNQVSRDRVSGRIDLGGALNASRPSTRNTQTSNRNSGDRSSGRSISRRRTNSPPASTPAPRTSRGPVSPPTSVSIPVPAPRNQSPTSNRTSSGRTSSGSSNSARRRPAPPPTPRSVPLPQPGTPINIPVPRPERSSAPPSRRPSPPVSGRRGDTLPVLLPVPNGNAPIGDSSGLPPVSPVSRRVGADSPPPPPTGPVALGQRYRVTVDARSPRQQQRVQELVPEAFRTILGGRVVMQVGVFRDRDNAAQIVRMLERNGLRASLQEL
ncbi:MAG: DUF1565 domain-containing protein [Oscillatoria sp. SIO1A7]|nr:DUF1565 domain-containing protein [Oscillatoria sp. SIO1A7]